MRVMHPIHPLHLKHKKPPAISSNKKKLIAKVIKSTSFQLAKVKKQLSESIGSYKEIEKNDFHNFLFTALASREKHLMLSKNEELAVEEKKKLIKHSEAFNELLKQLLEKKVT